MHNVLITKELTKKQRAIAADYGLNVTEQPFIKITYEFDTVEIPIADAWILTSPNAAKYIDAHFDEIPEYVHPEVVFCIGESTADHIQNLDLNIQIPSYGSAENVVEMVKQFGVNSAVFFRGNLSREVIGKELSNTLEEYAEIQVYTTEKLHLELDMLEFEAVAFFSPSGVEAFAKNNEISIQKVIAIGSTTKKAVETILKVPAGIAATTKMEDVLFALKEDLESDEFGGMEMPDFE